MSMFKELYNEDLAATEVDSWQMLMIQAIVKV